jgi:molecular chaperone GrpE
MSDVENNTVEELLVEATPEPEVVGPTLEQQLADMKDAWLRAKAEAENIRRRSQDEIVKARKFALESFAEDLLAVKDSLEMSLATDTLAIDTLKEGVEITLNQLADVFKKNRIAEVAPQVGDVLDPVKHQAIATVESEQEVNTIVTVMQKGYMIADRLLRPAMVTAAKERVDNEHVS